MSASHASSPTLLTVQGGRGVEVVRLLASPSKRTGFDSRRGSLPVFPHVRIVPDDATGRWIFSGISRFSRTCIPELIHSHLASTSSTFNTTIASMRTIPSAFTNERLREGHGCNAVTSRNSTPRGGNVRKASYRHGGGRARLLREITVMRGKAMAIFWVGGGEARKKKGKMSHDAASLDTPKEARSKMGNGGRYPSTLTLRVTLWRSVGMRRQGKREIPEKIHRPAAIVRQNSHARKFLSDLSVYRTWFALLGQDALAAAPLRLPLHMFHHKMRANRHMFHHKMRANRHMFHHKMRANSQPIWQQRRILNIFLIPSALLTRPLNIWGGKVPGNASPSARIFQLFILPLLPLFSSQPLYVSTAVETNIRSFLISASTKTSRTRYVALTTTVGNFARGDRGGRRRYSAGFLGMLPFSPPCHLNREVTPIYRRPRLIVTSTETGRLRRRSEHRSDRLSSSHLHQVYIGVPTPKG
ncbi:hypothetical protein PR048_019286 [Dryococelus australis]|uniref:Uncharacterized protein n=1 Tax=Dryococelus australis TaxID=614101 RepID=A0ABQ9H327_9NEOP|nr:hypothetical protein PR048_019286 [Dryococelus australis]